MSDYTKTVDFAAKDLLPSGNAAKVAKGEEVDTELDNIQIAVNSKFDAADRGSANGIASLDASSLVPSSELPTANTTTVGALETATSAEATALSAANKILVPSVFGAAATAWGDLNAGMIADIQALADPAADVLLGWDDSADAVIGFTLGSGLEASGTGLLVTQADILLVNLGDYDANDHIDHTTVDITAGVALTGGGSIAATRTLDVDISALTNMDISESAAADSILVNDGGVMKQMDIQDMGVRVVENAASKTLAIGDANTFQLLTGAVNYAFDLPTNAAVAYPIGTIIYVGSRDSADLVISPNTSAVTLTSTLRSDVGPSAGDHTVEPGGIAAVVKVATNEWMITGDIS